MVWHWRALEHILAMKRSALNGKCDALNSYMPDIVIPYITSRSRALASKANVTAVMAYEQHGLMAYEQYGLSQRSRIGAPRFPQTDFSRSDHREFFGGAGIMSSLSTRRKILG